MLIAACGEKGNAIDVTDAYAFETPATMPAAAVFMRIENNTQENERLLSFTTDKAQRGELHTMETLNDIMRMRRVDEYKIAAGKSFDLTPSGAHIMLFDLTGDLTAGETIFAVATFENAGEIPVRITIRKRGDSVAAHKH